jgi:AhpD family alkylhydroperoxidase
MDYLAERDRLEKRLLEFGQEHPGPMTGFARLHKKAVEAGALDTKVKELMALAISVVVGCDGCIAYHVYNAVKAGAVRQELIETLGVALMMGGGPGSIYIAHAMEAIEQILTQEL